MRNTETPYFYSRLSILFFTTLLSSIFGCFMYIHNLKAAERQKAIVPAFILSLLWIVAWFRFFESLNITNWQIILFLPNFTAGLLFSTVFWELHFRQVGPYRKRSLWIPMVIGCIAYGTYFMVAEILKD